MLEDATTAKIEAKSNFEFEFEKSILAITVDNCTLFLSSVLSPKQCLIFNLLLSVQKLFRNC